MTNAKHEGAHPASCPKCITKAERERMPWQDWIGYMSQRNAAFQKEHETAIRARESRKARAQAYRDCGLVKVRGALGGTYWE